jgi:hypothetical protein
MVPTTPIAPTKAPAPRLTLPAALLLVVAEAAPELAALLDMLWEPVMDAVEDMLWPEERRAGPDEVEAAETVAGSTEAVAGTLSLVERVACGIGSTYRDGSLAGLNSEVVGGNEGSETGRVDVLLDLECTEGSTGSGEVGRRAELRWLRVDHNDVSVKSGGASMMIDLLTGGGQIPQRVQVQRSRC